jgi:hypothetical protein
LHCAVAPAGLLFSFAAVEFLAGAATGFGAGAMVVLAGDEAVAVRHWAKTLLYHLVQSVVVEVAVVVLLTAPAVLPVGVCAAAVLQAALFALPALVQS